MEDIEPERKVYKNLKVYYGFSKLNKIIKKRELAIYFENANNNSNKNERYVSRAMDIIHIRKQSKEESEDSVLSNRTFTKYGYLIDDKRWGSDIDKILQQNFLADENHVSEKERNLIKEKLKEWYLQNYSENPKLIQLSLF